MYQLILNLIPQGILPRINVSQYDHGQTVDVTLYEGSTAYTLPSGATVTVSGTKADNTGFEYNCTTTGGLSFTIADQMTVFAGEVECELTIRYGNNRISTINFILDVERAALQDDVVISETDLPILQQIPEYAAQASADADRAEQAAATAMSTDAGKVTDRLNLNNCRNLVVPADIEYTQNGVTIKTNSDGSITLSGTNTRNSDFTLWANLFDENSNGNNDSNPQKWFPNGKYRVYGDIVGGRIQSGSTNLAYVRVLGYDVSENVVFNSNSLNTTYNTFTVTDEVTRISVTLFIKDDADFGNGQNINPVIATDSTDGITEYEQGSYSNRTLTIMTKDIDMKLDCGDDTLMNEGIKYPVINGIRNYVDISDVYHKNMGCVDLGTLNWQKVGTNRFNTDGVASLIKIPITAGEMSNIKCFKYTTDTFANVYSEVNKTIAVAYSTTSTAGNINIVDTAYSDAAAFKSAMSGVLLFYELATPQTWNTKSIVGLDALATTDKTLIGAINELKARIDAL